jgi:hypothetical protein
MKWMEFFQSYTFVLKHRFGRSNKVVDALSKRTTLLTTMIVEMVGLEEMKKLYEIDANFDESWKACKEPWSGDQTPFLDYIIQEGFLFRNQQHVFQEDQ